MRLAALVRLLPVAFLLAACGVETSAPNGAVTFHAEGRPAALSDWGVARVEGGALVLGDGVVPYDLTTPLFTDYAHKLRAIWMPEGTPAGYEPVATLDFPVGTIIAKTFYYPRDGDQALNAPLSADEFAGEGLDLAHVRLMETRLLVHREAGWVAFPYVWNAEQTDAVLKRAGDVIPMAIVDASGAVQDFPYIVPTANQCAGCHADNNTTRELKPIGSKARHMNRDYAYADGPENQLEHLARVGYLDGLPDARPRNAVWTDETESLDARARAYLEINCAHCHNPAGAADTSGLFLEVATPFGPHLGLCKAPIATGGGSGGHAFDIVPGDPDASILAFRMASDKPDEMMPELGRSLVHEEGVALVRDWIASLEGDCG